MFSPWYAWARRGAAAADPLDHCAVNVALYGRAGKRWAMTERPRQAVARGADWLAIGPSSLRWDGEALVVRFAERSCPLPYRITGTVRLHPGAISRDVFALDATGRHHWQPIAPQGRVEVALSQPALRWSGPAYLDSNAGEAPLEQDFVSWDWCRAPLRQGAAILYNVERRDGTAQSLALRVRPDGSVDQVSAPPPAALPRTRWRLARPTRAEAPPRLLQTLEDAPFYSRSVIATRLLGEDVTAVHESLSCDRFSALPVQAMLPFRAPRAWR